MASRRFIAGASCPSCNQIDKIYIFSREGQKYRACVNCDFEELMRFDSAPAELQTRVNKGAVVVEERVVRLSDSGTDKR